MLPDAYPNVVANEALIWSNDRAEWERALLGEYTDVLKQDVFVRGTPLRAGVASTPRNVRRGTSASHITPDVWA
jgi:hypothetical protein